MSLDPSQAAALSAADPETSALDLLADLVHHWKLLLLGPLLAAALAVGYTYTLAPTFTARVTFVPPQSSSGGSAAALGQLGNIANFAVGSGAIKAPVDQLISLMQSNNVSDRLIAQFGLTAVYGAKTQTTARAALNARCRIQSGKKDGLVYIEMDDSDPRRAADIANHYVVELKRLTSELALTEAQQRRAFFEVQLRQSREKVLSAQAALASTGIGVDTLRLEARAAIDGYAKAQAELSAAEQRLSVLKTRFSEASPEMMEQAAVVASMRMRTARLEADSRSGPSSEYVAKYRDFKYNESLLEVVSRQYEAARLEEAKDPSLIQVVDAATPPEGKSGPRRGFFGVAVYATVLVVLVMLALGRGALRRASAHPQSARRLARIRAAFRA